jgi:hypothetical protein
MEGDAVVSGGGDGRAVPGAAGHGVLYSEHIVQANEGCDFGFLIRRGGYPEPDQW